MCFSSNPDNLVPNCSDGSVIFFSCFVQLAISGDSSECMHVEKIWPLLHNLKFVFCFSSATDP